MGRKTGRLKAGILICVLFFNSMSGNVYAAADIPEGEEISALEEAAVQEDTEEDFARAPGMEGETTDTEIPGNSQETEEGDAENDSGSRNDLETEDGSEAGGDSGTEEDPVAEDGSEPAENPEIKEDLETGDPVVEENFQGSGSEAEVPIEAVGEDNRADMEEGREPGIEQEAAAGEVSDGVIVYFYTMKADSEYYLLAERETDAEGKVFFPSVEQVSGFRFAGWETEDFRRVGETDVFTESCSLYAAFVPEEGTAFSVMSRASSMGISSSNPKVGQENRYEYSGGRVNWTVPVTGYYDLYCYGAQGGTGYAENGTSSAASGSGSYGDAAGSRVMLKKGMVLTVCAGQMPGLSTIHLGQGDTNGQDWSGGPYEYVDGYETFLKEWSHAGDRTNGECFRYRGYPDGGYGGKEASFCNNTSDHAGGAAGGGGGGSSSVTCNGAKIISARGGNGAAVSYRSHDFSGTAGGGTGGGFTGVRNASGITWLTDKLNMNTSGANVGNGYVLIRVAEISPIIYLEASTKDWTNEDIVLTVRIDSLGQGLSGDYLSWKTDAEGNDIWTDHITCTVGRNGTYTCKIRDIAGNTSQASIVVSNIDKQKPSGEIISSVEEWTREDVELKVDAKDAEATAEYGASGMPQEPYLWGVMSGDGGITWGSADGGESGGSGSADETPDGDMPEPAVPDWTDRDSYTASQNGTYVCRVRDNVGNTADIVYKVTNIDKLPPEVQMVPSVREWTNQDIVISGRGSDGETDGYGSSGIHDRGYAWGVQKTSGEITWLTFGEGDNTGEPESPGDSGSPETAEVLLETGAAGGKEETGGSGKDEGEDEATPNWTDQDTLTVSQNGTYVFRMKDNAGNETQSCIRITNMDRLAPVGVITADTTEQVKKVALRVSGNDADATASYGSSGIAHYRWMKEGEEEKDASDGQDTFTAQRNGTYICVMQDRAGNTTELRYTVSNIIRPSGGSSAAVAPGDKPADPPPEKPPAEEIPVQSGSLWPKLLEKIQALIPEETVPVKKHIKMLDASSSRLPASINPGRGSRGGRIPKERNKTESDRAGKGAVTNIREEPQKPEPVGKRWNFLWFMLAAVAAAMFFIGLIFFILFYTRAVDILAMNREQEYVLLGSGRIGRRKEVWRIRIGKRIYERAETENFEIRPCRRFRDKHKGKWMLVLCREQKIPVLINEEIRLRIPPEKEA